MNKSFHFRSLLLVVWSILLTALTFVFGAIPLRALRLQRGRSNYWIMTSLVVGILLLTGAYPVAMGFASVACLIGCFTDFEEKKFSLVTAGLSALIITSLVAAGMFFIWCYLHGLGWLKTLEARVGEIWNHAAKIYGLETTEIAVRDILLQIPGVFVVLLISALVVGLAYGHRLASLVGGKKLTSPKSLESFRLPDAFMWFAIAVTLGTFLQTDLGMVQTVSANFFKVCVALYFFQGLAVCHVLFLRKMDGSRMMRFLRVLLLAFLVLQLSVLVAFLGFVDYWLDFRSKWAERFSDLKNQIKTKK